MSNPPADPAAWSIEARLGPRTGAGKAQVGIAVFSAATGLEASEIEVDWSPGMEDVDVLATALMIAANGALAQANALQAKALAIRAE